MRNPNQYRDSAAFAFMGMGGIIIMAIICLILGN